MLVIAAAIAMMGLKMDQCLTANMLVEAPVWENTGQSEIPVIPGIVLVEGEGLDGILVGIQVEVMDGGHLRPSPVQQLKVGMPDPLER